VPIEHARACALPKPWGIFDLRPWSNVRHEDGAIGEIWYERSDRVAAEPSLLLKILFTNQPLSIQVHPDDVFAHSIGLPHGKTEAWYVLRAASDAKVALGLNQRLTQNQLRAAVDDGSSSQKSNSAATPRFVSSITGGSAPFTSRTQSRPRTLGQLISRDARSDSLTNGRFSSPVRISWLNGSSCRRIPLGASTGSEKPGFSFLTVMAAPNHATWPLAMLSLYNPIASVCKLARPAW
jgi:hypothetical protein